MKNFGFTRLWIKISSVFGIILMVILLGVYAYYENKYLTGGANQAKNSLLIRSYTDLGSISLIIPIILVWMLAKTVVCNIGLIRYANLSDEELCANKWALAVLSLSIGGFLAPFSLTWLPNANETATKNARTTIVRYMGISWAIGGVLTGIALLAIYAAIPSANKVWTGNSENIFTAIVAVVFILGALSFLMSFPFYGEKAEKALQTDTGAYKWFGFVTVVFCVIVTIELIIQMIWSLLKALEALARIGNSSGIGRILAIFYAFAQLVSTMFMIYLISKVIHGLWTNKGRTVTFNRYDRYAQAQEQRTNQRSSY